MVLVDTSPSQAKAVSDEFGLRWYCTDFQSLPIDVDAAIVTSPHRFHAQHSIHFLRKGIPVFVEKPLAMSASDAADMLEAASSGGTILMVNNCRRLFPAYQEVRQIIQSGQFGKLQHVSIHDGDTFGWNSVSAFYLRDQAARGVFLDRGAHTVDILCWWLSGQLRVVDARCDTVSGAEAVMAIQLACQDIPIHITFSRLHKLENCYRLQFENAQLHGRLFDPVRLHIVDDAGSKWITAGEPCLYQEYARRLVENFVAVVQGTEQPLFTAEDVAASISVLEQGYERAIPFDLPWYESDPNISFLREARASRV
jgi:predicted dehydrogenase